MGIKAVGLMSGGLDSALAMRMMLEQGIEMTGISCIHPFHKSTRGREARVIKAARELGIEVERPDVSAEMIRLAGSPPHGFGRFRNPCIDCRILYLAKGRELMDRIGASFLVTGEVLGQRPMSQRRDALDIVIRDAGLRGLVLRPLSAKLLAPTIPEEKGWVDREKLEDISGRGRSRQLELAGKFGLEEWDSPAGGCLLTMEDFARKVGDLYERVEFPAPADVELLKLGRHFRLSAKARLVVGKNDRDNHLLLAAASPGDTVIISAGLPGPVGLVTGEYGEDDLTIALGIVGRYRKPDEGPVLSFKVEGPGGTREMEASPFDAFEVDDYRV